MQKNREKWRKKALFKQPPTFIQSLDWKKQVSKESKKKSDYACNCNKEKFEKRLESTGNPHLVTIHSFGGDEKVTL